MPKIFVQLAKSLACQNTPSNAGWVKASKNGKSITWKKINDDSKDLPNVGGMTLRDAMHILENKGFRVRYSGLGKSSRICHCSAKSCSFGFEISCTTIFQIVMCPIISDKENNFNYNFFKPFDLARIFHATPIVLGN